MYRDTSAGARPNAAAISPVGSGFSAKSSAIWEVASFSAMVSRNRRSNSSLPKNASYSARVGNCTRKRSRSSSLM